MFPPAKSGLAPGIFWYMKIGRNSVTDRGSSNRNGLVTGEMNPSKAWSPWNQSPRLPNHPSAFSPHFSDDRPGTGPAGFPGLTSSFGYPDRRVSNSFTGSRAVPPAGRTDVSTGPPTREAFVGDPSL